jgi:hypothetical protein
MVLKLRTTASDSEPLVKLRSVSTADPVVMLDT